MKKLHVFQHWPLFWLSPQVPPSLQRLPLPVVMLRAMLRARRTK